MKKIMIVFVMLIFTFLFSATNNNGLVGKAYAWDDCPNGLVNDKYPGSCPRYIDTDNDGICDHSQPAPEDRDSFKTTNQGSLQEENNASTKKAKDYYFKQITLVLLAGYGVTFLLTKLGKISTVQHRKFWNIGLTLSFLVNGLLGVLLVIKISYGIDIVFPFNILFWHVETGIIFAMVAIFHFAWHFPYYKRLFK